MTDTELQQRDREEERLRRRVQRGPSWGGAFLALCVLLAVVQVAVWLWSWLTGGVGR